MPRRVLAVASVLTAIVVPGLAAQQQAAPPPAAQAAVRPGSGVTVPRLLKAVEPIYTTAAEVARIAGSVELEAVVGANGTVTEVRVTRSLDKELGLDAEAVKAARGWLFEPGRKDGQPVPVIVTLILEFRLNGLWLSAREQQMFLDATAEETPGLVKPTLIKSVEAKFTSEAMRAKIEGIVEVELVVLSDGTVGAARIAKSLDPVHGLDSAALRAVRNWLFRPGTLNGKPVPVKTKVTVPFTLG